MELVKEYSSFKVYKIGDGKFSVYNGWLEINHYDPKGLPLGEGRYGSPYTRETANRLVKEVVAGN